MHQKLFTIPLPEFLSRLLGVQHISIFSYAFLIVLGTVIACLYIKRKAKAQLNNLIVPNSVFYKIFLAGFIGGKLLCYLETPALYINNPKALLEVFSGGFVCYGSVLFIAAYVVYYTWKHKINALAFLDIVAIAAIIPQVLGRVGCFLGGCCYGIHTDSYFGVNFPGITTGTVHPTQLYEAWIMSIVFTGLIMINKQKKIPGQVFSIYLISYALVRFSLEFIRGDSRGFLLNGLISHSQTISIISILVAGILFSKSKKQYQSLNQI